MSARRKPVTGGGNPSNFEQQMLLSGIPDPSKLFTFTEFNIHRLRTIAILQILNNARTMQNHGYELTETAIETYNSQYSQILGRRLTRADFTKYQAFMKSSGKGLLWCLWKT